MFREIFRSDETDTAVNHPKPESAFRVAEKYQIKCTPQEAFAQLIELQLRKGELEYNPALDYQIATIAKVISIATSKSQVFPPEITFSIMGELWEDSRGLTNHIVGNVGHQTPSWQTRSWILGLLGCNYDPQKQLEKASKLGLIDENTDPYVLREALMKWKEDNPSS